MSQPTTPTAFVNPHSCRNKVGRVLWSICHLLLFRIVFRFFGNSVRNAILRAFGAKIGRACINPTARIWAPWMLEIGDDVFVDRDVYLFNPFGITVGDRTIISFGTVLSAVSHDYTDPAYRLVGKSITLKSDIWICAEAFVGSGVTVGEGAVVGARAVVTKDVEPWAVVAGNPAKLLRRRVMRSPTSPSANAS